MNYYPAGVVDQTALITALKTGQIAAAGLDVMEPEPLPFDHELTQLSNCGKITHSLLSNQRSLERFHCIERDGLQLFSAAAAYWFSDDPNSNCHGCNNGTQHSKRFGRKANAF